MSSLVNIQSLISFLKKQIKTDMKTEIDNIKNEYQTKINELNNQISELSKLKSDDEIHVLFTQGIHSDGVKTVNKYTCNIDTSNFDKSYKNYYLLLSRSCGNNVANGYLGELTNLSLINCNGSGIIPCNYNNMYIQADAWIYKINDINKNVSFNFSGAGVIFIIGI